jgi:hypothetical protein
MPLVQHGFQGLVGILRVEGLGETMLRKGRRYVLSRIGFQGESRQEQLMSVPRCFGEGQIAIVAIITKKPASTGSRKTGS